MEKDTYLLIAHITHQELLDQDSISLLKEMYGKKVKIYDEFLDIFYHEFITEDKVFVYKNGKPDGVITVMDEAEAMKDFH